MQHKLHLCTYLAQVVHLHSHASSNQSSSAQTGFPPNQPRPFKHSKMGAGLSVVRCLLASTLGGCLCVTEGNV